MTVILSVALSFMEITPVAAFIMQGPAILRASTSMEFTVASPLREMRKTPQSCENSRLVSALLASMGSVPGVTPATA